MAGPTDLVSLFDVFLDTVKDHKDGNAAKTGNNFSVHHLSCNVLLGSIQGFL